MSIQYSTGSVSNVRRFSREIPLYFDLTPIDESPALEFFSRLPHFWLKDGETATVKWDTDAPLQAGRHEALEVNPADWPA